MNQENTSSEWTLIGKTEELIRELETHGLKELEFNKKKVVLTYHDGAFGALTISVITWEGHSRVAG